MAHGVPPATDSAAGLVRETPRDGVWTRVAKSLKENVRDQCPCLRRVRHLFSRGFACFAAEGETRLDNETANTRCLTQRHRECSLFRAHEAEQRRRA